jgi:hypothetical protein
MHHSGCLPALVGQSIAQNDEVTIKNDGAAPEIAWPLATRADLFNPNTSPPVKYEQPVLRRIAD